MPIFTTARTAAFCSRVKQDQGSPRRSKLIAQLTMPEQSPPEVSTAKRLGAPSRAPAGVEAPEARGEVGREGAGVSADPGTFLAFRLPRLNDMVSSRGEGIFAEKVAKRVLHRH